MIYYISEDSDTSPFVKLFNAAYDTDILFGVGSNKELVRAARQFAQGDNQVVVYLDLVPDNPVLPAIYDRLLRLYLREHLDVVVFPIVCAEYCFVKSIRELSGPFCSRIGLTEVLSKSAEYRDSSLAKEYASDRSANFERFCKLFCEVCLSQDCCSTYGSSDTVCGRAYFSGKCSCQNCDTHLTMSEKAKLYLSQFLIVPGLPGSSCSVSWEDVIERSRDAIREYNTWAKSFNLNSFDLKTR